MALSASSRRQKEEHGVDLAVLTAQSVMIAVKGWCDITQYLNKHFLKGVNVIMC